MNVTIAVMIAARMMMRTEATTDLSIVLRIPDDNDDPDSNGNGERRGRAT